MASDVKAQCAGLVTSTNPFSSAPPGALAVADECVLDETNVLETRRGFEATTYGFGISSDRANVFAWYGSTQLVQYASALCRDTGSAFTDYSGTFAVVDATLCRMRFVFAQGNAYFNCVDGCRVLDSVAGTPTQAGVPRHLKTYAIPASNNGWQTPDTNVAYRGVWGIVDANGNEKLGVPSGRYVGTNAVPINVGSMTRAGAVVTVIPSTLVVQSFNIGDTFTLTPGEANFAAGLKTITGVSLFTNQFTYAEAGAAVSNTVAQEFQRTRSQTVTLYIPAGITTSHFFRIYRSEMSANAATEASDELYLCYEGKPSGGDIAAGFVDVNDICPENMLGDAAPWNANDGDGLVNSNERPPVALDLAYWDNSVWYANCTQRHRFFLNLLGIGSPQGVQNNDTVTIAGTTYTFKSAAGAWPEVSIYTAFTLAQNIEKTARALVDAINGYASSTLVRATYNSGENEPAGKIFIEEILIGGSSFSVSASRAASWNPALTRTSDNNRHAHGLMYSKPGQPEAVPLVNEVLVGSQNDAILRVVPLKQSLIVFKQYEGIWEVVGSNGRYTATKLGVANLLAPETVRVFADRVWCLTDQGETTIAEGAGVTVTSYNIENNIIPLTGAALSALKLYSFGVAHESARRYLLWLPVAQSNTWGRQAFVYSTGTKGFTRWLKHARCGGVSPTTDLLYLGSSTSNKVLYERKSFDYTDYQDETFSVTISSVTSPSTVTLNTSGHGVVVGDCLDNGGAPVPVIVTAVNGADLTVSQDPTIYLPASGAITVHTGIACSVRWQPVTGGNPASVKMARQVTFLVNGCNATTAKAKFSSDMDPTEQPVSLTFDSPAYAVASTAKTCRVSPLPAEHAQASQLTVGLDMREAYASFKLHGFVLDFEADGEKGGRR